ncbi:hypothetical protein [Olivibacter sp. XZL3]|uniref:hypothetical protein n=1 Tax=Olivibacter sp. XZL3 TaxID=1735116 RepID=UPI00106543E1|nr:hypothetical protein [Olivibacter sp. XZL3]
MAVHYSLKIVNVVWLLFLLSRNSKQNYVLFLISIPLLWATVDEENVFKSVMYIVSMAMPVWTFLLLRNDEKVFIARLLLKWIAILMVPGLFFYILFQFGIDLRSGVWIRPSDSRSYIVFYHLLYSLEFVRYRFFAVFDEPGVVGTFAAMVVFYYRNVLPKWQYRLYLVAGVLSFSMFFVVLCLPLAYFSRIGVATMQEKIKKIFFTFFFLGASYLLLCFTIPIISASNPIIQRALNDRLIWKGDFIVGLENNREVMTEGYEKFVTEGGMQYWLGNGKGSYREETGTGSLSYRVAIFEKGMLFTIYILSFFIVIHPWRKQFLFSLISLGVIFLTYYQRPLLYKIDIFILLFVGIMLAQGASPLIKTNELDNDV